MEHAGILGCPGLKHLCGPEQTSFEGVTSARVMA